MGQVGLPVKGLQVGRGGEAGEGGRAAHGVQDRRRDHFGRERAHLAGGRPRALREGARCERKGGIAIAGRVDGIDRAGVAVLGHLRYPGGLRLGEARVGGDDPDGRVLTGRPARLEPATQQNAGVCQGGAVLGAYARDHPAGCRVDHVAHGIDRHQGGHHQPAGQRERGAPDPTFHRAAHPCQLPYGSARAGADTPRLHGARGRTGRRLVPALGSGTDRPVPPYAQIVQDGRGHDRDAYDRADRVPDPPLLQIAHHPAGGVQPEGASAGEHDRVYGLDGVDRIEQVGLARAGRPSRHVHARDRTGRRQHDRAPGGTLREGVVAHLDPGHVGEATGGGGAGLLRPSRPRAQEQQGGDNARQAHETAGRVSHTARIHRNLPGPPAIPVSNGRPRREQRGDITHSGQISTRDEGIGSPDAGSTTPAGGHDQGDTRGSQGEVHGGIQPGRPMRVP